LLIFSLFFIKKLLISDKNSLISSYSVIYLYILPKLIAIPALNAKRLVLNIPLTLVFPFGVRVLTQVAQKKWRGIFFRKKS
jgi:hypothetical protein